MYNSLFKDISIIIVTYKSENVIFKCLKNLIKFKNIYILDNSNSHFLQKKIKKKYKKINFFLSRNKIG